MSASNSASHASSGAAEPVLQVYCIEDPSNPHGTTYSYNPPPIGANVSGSSSTPGAPSQARTTAGRQSAPSALPPPYVHYQQFAPDTSSSAIDMTSTSSASKRKRKSETASTSTSSAGLSSRSNIASSSRTVKAETSTAAPSASKKRKGKAKAEDQKPQAAQDPPMEEKRKAIFRKKESGQILDRVARVMTQRMFCISRNKESDIKEVFQVSGSTGNVYTVTIDELPRCTCPDFMKGHICKHVLFCFLKVLGCPRHEHYHYQKALLPSELRHIFANARANPSARAPDQLVRAYQLATGQIDSDKEKQEAEESRRRKIPAQGDACPICYEDFTPGSTKGLTFCDHSCGNAMHNECFRQWANQPSSKGRGGGVTCCFCRAEFPDKTADVNGASRSIEGYLNLARVAGVKSTRDQSTYHYHYFDDGSTSPGANWSRGRYRNFGGRRSSKWSRYNPFL